MVNLGTFTSNGKCYIGHFIPESNTVELFGPLQDMGGGAPRVLKDTAISAEDAKKKINDAIEHMKKYYFNCKRFESFTKPCPHKDNEDLIAVKNWQSKTPPTNYLGEEIERATAVCLACDYFEPLNPKRL